MNWERLDLLKSIGLGQCLDPERFRAPSVMGHDFRINTKELIRLTAHGPFNPQMCSFVPLQKWELKSAMYVSCARDPGHLVYAQ